MAKKIKILMIAFQHCANDDRIFYKEALSLLKNGFIVSYLVLTDKEGYIRDMSGRILNKERESNIFLEGVKIIGIKPPAAFLTSMLNKVFLGKFQKEIISLILEENANIYHAHEPISLRIAIKAAKISNNKVIFDSHESWVGGTIKEKLIKIKYLNKIKYMISVNNGIIQNLSRKAKFTITEIIYNCSLPALFPLNKASEKINTPVVLAHEGVLSFNRGLKNMLHALLILKEEFPNIKLKIIGNSPIKESVYISRFILNNGLQKNIIKTGWVKYEDISRHLINCDIGLILYTASKNNLYSTSNKLFNYIASGLAIVSMDLPETKKIINPLNNGIIVENHKGKEIAESISKLIKDPLLLLEKKIASQNAYQKYNWAVEEKKLINFYKNVLTD